MAREEDPVFPAVSLHGRQSVTCAHRSCNLDSEARRAPFNGAETQIAKWNCVVSVRPIHFSFAGSASRRVPEAEKSFFGNPACADRKGTAVSTWPRRVTQTVLQSTALATGNISHFT